MKKRIKLTPNIIRTSYCVRPFSDGYKLNRSTAYLCLHDMRIFYNDLIGEEENLYAVITDVNTRDAFPLTYYEHNWVVWSSYGNSKKSISTTFLPEVRSYLSRILDKRKTYYCWLEEEV